MINIFNDIKLKVWYRNFKIITAVDITDNTVKLSNGDKIFINGNDIFINNKLVCNFKITPNELLELYKHHLVKKGYKLI
jgi:hypothetical protein